MSERTLTDYDPSDHYAYICPECGAEVSETGCSQHPRVRPNAYPKSRPEPPPRFSCTITLPDGWRPGTGALTTLRSADTPDAAARPRVEGTAADFRVALERARREREGAQADAVAIDRLVDELAAALARRS